MNLLGNRWRKVNGVSTFHPYTDLQGSELLTLVLTERRRELMCRGLRWQDIKRLNREGAGIHLSRTLNGTVYNLPANDLRYALPVPQDVIEIAGIRQNPR